MGPNILRDLMRPLYPMSVPVTAQDLTNMRLKVKRIIKKETAATAKGLVLGLELDPADHDYLLTKDNGMLAMDLQSVSLFWTM